ncbi:hypothetical protein FQR65_LT17008 [Abscondita terminalis]|nr:hypothetical protein FQR65_LT17008 [Abscondita terminalis]
MTLVREFLTEANVPWYEKEAFEGDDIMGTISNICVKLGYDVEIVSNDKDCFQLVNDKVSILRQKTAKTCVEYMKALIGDSSDNIKGLRGLHADTAKKLISKYDSIENIYKNIDDFEDFQKEKFLNYKEQILINKKIATILKNVQLGRINLKPLRVNYIKFMRFLKKEKMWAFTKKIEEVYTKQLEERQKWYEEKNKPQ